MNEQPKLMSEGCESVRYHAAERRAPPLLKKAADKMAKFTRDGGVTVALLRKMENTFHNANACMMIREYDKAIQLYREYVTFYTWEWRGWNNLSVALKLAGKLEEAAAAFECAEYLAARYEGITIRKEANVTEKRTDRQD